LGVPSRFSLPSPSIGQPNTSTDEKKQQQQRRDIETIKNKDISSLKKQRRETVQPSGGE
jgi:hypothetical protein